MMDEVRRLLDEYQAWLRDRTVLRQVAEHIEITTPYLDRHNDYLQIYAIRSDGGYILSDDGYVVDDLRQSGCSLDTQKRQALLNMTLNGFGVQLHEGALQIHASPENFALRKHSLVQAMLAVNDLFYLAEPMVLSLFLEDVVKWLDQNDIRHTPRVKFTGKTGYDHLFDFVIPKSRRQPERILKALNRPTRDTAQAMAFSWIDTKEVRPPESRAYALLNDTDRDVSVSVLDALRNYDVKPVLWSHRSEVQHELVA